jgi:hypothetical protein
VAPTSEIEAAVAEGMETATSNDGDGGGHRRGGHRSVHQQKGGGWG